MTRPAALLVLCLAAACEPLAHDMRGPLPDGGCFDGDQACQGIQTHALCVDGGWLLTECEGVCAEGLGCVDCLPGTRSCADSRTVVECADDGTGQTEVDRCDEGERCLGGQCSAGCGGGSAVPSSLGCEFWPLDLDNAESKPMGMFVLDRAAAGQLAVGVLCPASGDAVSVSVEVDQAAPGEAPRLVTLENAVVEPGGSHLFLLPRRDVDGEGIVEGHDDGDQTGLSRRSFRLTSTGPVAAFQWNPIDDAACTGVSLLLPVQSLDTRYRVVGYSPGTVISAPGLGIQANRSYVTIVGTAADTQVTVTPAYEILAGGGVPAIGRGEAYEVVLDAFDVLNLETVEQPGFFAPVPDLTGTLVEASAEVVVFSGVDAAGVPFQPEPLPGQDPEELSCTFDHIEEQVPPESALGRRYVVARSPVRSSSGSYVEPDYVRVVAVADGTSVTTSLGEAFDLDAGEAREIVSATSFVLEATGPVAVGQFLAMGCQTTAESGDPAFVQLPPVDQGLEALPFLVAGELAGQWVVVAAPSSAEPTLDGRALDWCSVEEAGALDGSTYLAYTCPVEPGVHLAEAPGARILATVYGYSDRAAWAYPAGTGLERLPPE